MSQEWSWKTNDRIVKLEGNWIRVSSVEAVEKSTSGSGCRVLLGSGNSISLPGTHANDAVDKIYSSEPKETR